ncbi:MAG TPA: heavy metal translocating P-type ATPase, partial [Gammaproteobacteria bacterium]
EAEIEGNKQQFCCLGCASVCKVIYDSGLQGFYQRTPEGQLLSPPPDLPKDIALYDIDEVQSEYVADMGQVRDIHLLVEGIHCAACIWLIERSFNSIPGILDVKANLANKRLHVRWDNSKIKLSSIIKRLGEIGYAAVPFDPESAEGIIKKQNRALLLRMAFAAFAMMNLMWVSIALYTGANEGEFRSMFHWIGFTLATPTLLYSGWPFYKGAWTGLRQAHLTMDLPIALGATITYLYSVYILVTGSAVGEVYFDTVVNFMFVILVGRFLEAKSKRHAVAATQRLLDLQPRVATVIRNDESHIVPIRSVKQGERVLVKAGDKIPVDGIVIDGATSVDESMLSGESEPVTKNINDHVSAGTINTESTITVKVEATLKNTALGRIINLVEEAQASKAPIQCVADSIVPWFVAATLILATLTFLWWVNQDFETALMAATAVMIITCPCAFGLATPMAIAVASGLGAKHGILVKNGAVLEYLSAINHFVFDKTGTLTQGQMVVGKIYSNKFSDKEFLQLVAKAEQFSEHSIAKAIIQSAKNAGIIITTHGVSDFKNKSGHGIKAIIDSHHIIIGTYDWLKKNAIEPDPEYVEKTNLLQRQGISCIHVAIDGSNAGLISVSDQLRPDAMQLINALRNAGIQLSLLSGDRQMVADAVAEELGGMNVIAEVLPEQKEQIIRQLQSSGEKVAMVGDGVNDAPALIRADVGIAVGSGTDVSMESADIVLLSNELDKVRLASMLSRRTLKTIRQNIGISLLYNIIMVPLAMMAFVTPLVAAISMPISSLAVIANAARIRTLFSDKTKY